jgi:hypothetical protein
MLSLRQRKINRLNKKAEMLYKYRQNNKVNDAAINKEIAIYKNLAKLYDKSTYNKKYPFARDNAIECFRAAAGLNDMECQYIIGKRLLEFAKYKVSLDESVFTSKSHAKYARLLFDEAFAFLEAAELAGHILAKRLKGLSFINGWGVDADKEKGFQLVVDSIELENNWDNATKIFQELGLNKPEFFTALMSHKNKMKI